MKKLPTRFAEQVYQVLVKYAEARPEYYERETFIFHFAVIEDTSDSFKLTCMDGVKRTFFCTNDRKMWIEGKGSDNVNIILERIRKIIDREYEFGDFIVKQRAI
jgi:hypothetical protein